VFINNSYVSDQILCSKCPPLADTQALSNLLKSFTPLAMDFCGKAVQIHCSASFNLGTFGVLDVAYVKLTVMQPKLT